MSNQLPPIINRHDFKLLMYLEGDVCSTQQPQWLLLEKESGYLDANDNEAIHSLELKKQIILGRARLRKHKSLIETAEAKLMSIYPAAANDSEYHK